MVVFVSFVSVMSESRFAFLLQVPFIQGLLEGRGALNGPSFLVCQGKTGRTLAVEFRALLGC